MSLTMAPDINFLSTRSPSIPSSPRAHHRPPHIATSAGDVHHPAPPSPRSPSLSSLQAAAAINASLHHSPPTSTSPARSSLDRTGLERRRSSLMTNFAINDPTIPAPGEMQTTTGSSGNSPRLRRRSAVMNGATIDPHHTRQPSLGELHQKLEEEQEAQANRLLHMIRIQQDQLNALQRQQQQHQHHPADSSPTTSDTPGLPAPPPNLSTNPFEQPYSRSGSVSGLPHGHGVFNRPTSLSRQSSSRISNPGTNSHAGSPALHPSTGSLGPLTEDFLLGGTRDESAFYQAETQMLTRENQMLRLRVRELERQIADLALPHLQQPAGLSTSPTAHSPLANAPATFSSESTAPVTAVSDSGLA